MLRRTGVLVLTATLVAAGGASAAQAQSSQTSSSRNKSIAKPMVAARGWNNVQFRCLERLWARESGWNHRAANGSGAYGIPQALPGVKMSSSGRDWRTNPRTQIKWGLGYIKQRYGTPCGAWGHFLSHNWY
ncbi:transglycosylase SLT domain-containing protein [Nonomuraea sp. LP-02]|uniref:aggregation-promoting factor C-terminal-like domain-containing protein n=1 Tax=Nonomuraea sp. LP-02 TaxID=3097960 RepID=UPI002E35E07E|nr:transglycosylase SLT domain-containing protein [Nonomuraea sp. LP-02]MED7922947.1 transglycosylase SLT domain-containing protein [Nonomuraea sp. LP-02]